MPDGPPEEERDKTELPTRARARSRRRAAGEPRGLTAFSPGELTPGRPPVAVPARRRPGPRRRLTRVRPHRQDRAIQLGGTCVSHETRVQRPLPYPTRGRFAYWARPNPVAQPPEIHPASSPRAGRCGTTDGGADRTTSSHRAFREQGPDPGTSHREASSRSRWRTSIRRSGRRCTRSSESA